MLVALYTCACVALRSVTSCCSSLSWGSSSPAPPGVNRRSVRASRQRRTVRTAWYSFSFTPGCEPSAELTWERNTRWSLSLNSTFNGKETIFSSGLILETSLFFLHLKWQSRRKTELLKTKYGFQFAGSFNYRKIHPFTFTCLQLTRIIKEF